MTEAGLVKPGADFANEFRRDPAAFDRSVQPHPPKTFSQGTGDPKALLGFVLERVDQRNPSGFGIDVPVKRVDRRHGVSEAQDESVGDRS